MPFEISPDLLDRVEFRSVGGERFEVQAREVGLQLAYFRTAVHVASVPDHNDRATEMFKELPHEPSNCHGFKVIVDEGAEVQPEALGLRRKRQGGGQRHLVVMLRPLFENGGLAFRGQCATDERRHEHAALVNQDQMGTQAACAF